MLPSECSEKAFCFISGSSDKTIRKWHVDVSKARFYGTQIRIGMLCDEYSHLKRITKAEEDTSDDLGQIRVLKVVKINNENYVFCGDACGYIWIFNSKDLFLHNIKEIHENEILDIAICKMQNNQDNRHNLIMTCSRDKKTKSFKFIDGEIIEYNEFCESELPVIGVDFIEESKDQVKLVYIDAKSNLSVRSVKENLTFSSATKKSLEPRKFYCLAVSENKIAIGMDSKIQFGELKANNYWALMKSAFSNQNKMKDFVKIEIDESGTFVFSSSWKSNDVHCIDFITTRTMATFSSGEPITCMKITPDNKYLITCSSRGCFYVWKLQKQIYGAMNFKIKQKEIPSVLSGKMLTGIAENEGESSDDNDDIDEGEALTPKRKEWQKLSKRNTDFNLEQSTKFQNSEQALLKPEEVRRIKSSFDYDAEVYNLEKLEDTLKTEQVDEVENEDVFDLLIDTPKIGGEKDDALKSKYDFEDIIHEK